MGLTGLAYLMLALVCVSALPAGIVALSYGWAGVPVGAATAALCLTVLGVVLLGTVALSTRHRTE